MGGLRPAGRPVDPEVNNTVYQADGLGGSSYRVMTTFVTAFR